MTTERGSPGFQPGEDPLQALVVRAVGLAPACGLQVGEEDDLFLRESSDASSTRSIALKLAVEVGAAVRQGDLLDLLDDLGMVGRRVADHDPGRVGHQHDADRVAPVRRP